MKREKAFDCVTMKDAIQERLAAKYAGMTPAERRQAVEHWLATSDDAIARKWRSFRPAPVQPNVSVAAETQQ